ALVAISASRTRVRSGVSSGNDSSSTTTGRPCSGGGRFVSEGGNMTSIGALYGEQGKGPANSCPILSRTPFIMVGMTDKLRVILEIGKKRKIAAAAVDWPGLDRWGTSEEGAQEKLASYIPRYADVAKRAGMERAFGRQRELDVVDRVPGSSSPDFWGVAHVPSEIERKVLSPADLERRRELLHAALAGFAC